MNTNLLWNPLNKDILDLKADLVAYSLDQEHIEDYWLAQWGYETYLRNTLEVFGSLRKK